MKTPLTRAILAAIAAALGFGVLWPSIIQLFLPAGSMIYLAVSPENPANEIRGFEIFTKTDRSFFPPLLVRSLKPDMIQIRLAVLPYGQGPVSFTTLFINCKDGMMALTKGTKQPPINAFETRFTEQALQSALDSLNVRQSPQRFGATEVHRAIQTIYSTDIRDENIPSLRFLPNFSVTYIHPYENTFLILIVLSSVLTSALRGYRTSKTLPQTAI